MYENNNKAVVDKLAKESIKTNRIRNIFTILAIILTTVLFTTVFTIGMSMIKSIEYSTMRQVGGSNHGGFKYLTNQEAEILKQHKDIKEYGIVIPVSIAENPQLAKRQTEINYMDDNAAKYRFVTPLMDGRMPEKENEIVLDTITLDMLGMDYELDKTVTLNYSIHGRSYSKDFILCGYYQGDIVSMASAACVSEDFIINNLTDIDQNLSKENGSYTGTIILELMFKNKYNIENKILKILQDSGFAEGDIRYGVNWAYMGNDSPVSLIDMIPLAALLLLIILSGYLIIYNLFYISVVKDVRFFGLLKTIGTTSKQIKKLIIKQAIRLSFIGIPIGLLIGYFVGVVLLPYVMQMLTFSHSAISLNPVIFIGSALFSIFTVLISCSKPAKLAAKTSPVEAVRYTGVSESFRKRTKKSTQGSRLHKMAFSNIFRNRKKALVVIVSLSISLILLNSVYTIVSGFDMDEYLSKQMGTDFTLGDTSFYRWNFVEGEQSNALTQELLDDIGKLQGMEGIGTIYNKQMLVPTTDAMEKSAEINMEQEDPKFKFIYERVLRDKEIMVDMYGMDEMLYPLLNEYIVDGELDIDLFSTGDYVVVWEVYYEGIKPGDKIILSNGEGETKEYTVMAIMRNPSLYMYSGKVILGTINIYLPSKEYMRYTDSPSIMTALFNVEDEYISAAEQYIQNKIAEIPTLDYRSKSIYEQEFKDMISTYNAVGYTLSLIIGMIGILNFTNVMITSIISRRQEFATIQSIGMTNGQLRKMLIFEGMYYAAITLSVVLIIGVPITYIIANMYAGRTLYVNYSFTILPIVLCTPVLLIISGLVPAINFKSIKNTSIVERLRETE